MKIQLIKGQFAASDAVELISQVVQVKIRYHESRINGNSHEEDIKSREARIKQLQNELADMRKNLLAGKVNVKIDAVIDIQ